MTNTRTRRRIAAASMTIGAAMIAFGLFAPSANAAGADKPAGNNGTVKIDGTEFDTHPNNEPHVGCIFQVDFYGMDALTDVDIEFAVHPPTGNAVIHDESHVLDNDDNSGGGSEAGLDGQYTINLQSALAPYTPHPQQGFHVKLTVTVDDHDSKGAQVKHKTFWVEGCEQPEGTTGTPDPQDGGTDGGTTTGGSTSGGTTGAVEATTGQAPTEVEGAVITPTAAPTALPATGAEDRSLVVLGIGFLAIGAVVMFTKRAVFIR